MYPCCYSNNVCTHAVTVTVCVPMLLQLQCVYPANTSLLFVCLFVCLFAVLQEMFLSSITDLNFSLEFKKCTGYMYPSVLALGHSIQGSPEVLHVPISVCTHSKGRPTLP